MLCNIVVHRFPKHQDGLQSGPVPLFEHNIGAKHVSIWAELLGLLALDDL